MATEFRTGFVRSLANPRNHSALVLNADFRPLSYCPLSLWPWQTSLKAAILDRVMVLSEYDRVVRSPSTEFRLPSVVALRDFVRPNSKPAFTRFHLFLRDEFTCQYCGSASELTFDHVIPRSQGGRTTWTNVVTACAPCNLNKGARRLSECGKTLRNKPVRPTSEQLLNAGRKFPPDYLHQSWMDFLYWDAELDA
ncbi:MAG: HNH endonuclease [Rhodobacteraceae bacterium]|nr:HNH endonuclease [Paracoccaceae bacterium]